MLVNLKVIGGLKIRPYLLKVTHILCVTQAFSAYGNLGFVMIINCQDEEKSVTFTFSY